MQTAQDLLKEMYVSGNVYVQIKGLTKLVRLHKTALIRNLKLSSPGLPIKFKIVNSEGVGRYSPLRRYIVIDKITY